jgi:hypothetical protein
LTMVARRAATGELIGVMLNEDCASAMPDGMERLGGKFDPILDILGQLSAEYWGDRSARPGESLHLFLLGVAEEDSGKGVAQRPGAIGARSRRPPTRSRSTFFASLDSRSVFVARMRIIASKAGPALLRLPSTEGRCSWIENLDRCKVCARPGACLRSHLRRGRSLMTRARGAYDPN